MVGQGQRYPQFPPLQYPLQHLEGDTHGAPEGSHMHLPPPPPTPGPHEPPQQSVSKRQGMFAGSPDGNEAAQVHFPLSSRLEQHVPAPLAVSGTFEPATRQMHWPLLHAPEQQSASETQGPAGTLGSDAEQKHLPFVHLCEQQSVSR